MATMLTSKSQLTLPKPIREYLKVGPGDRVEFRIGGDGSVRVEPVAAAIAKPNRRLLAKYRKLRGSGGRAGASTDELMRLLRGYDEDADDPGFCLVR